MVYEKPILKNVLKTFLMVCIVLVGVVVLCSCGSDYEKANSCSIEPLETGIDFEDGTMYQWFKITNNGDERIDYFSLYAYELDKNGETIKVQSEYVDSGDIENANRQSSLLELEPGKSAYFYFFASSNDTKKLDIFQYEYSVEGNYYSINLKEETAKKTSEGLDLSTKKKIEDWDLISYEESISGGKLNSIKLTNNANFDVLSVFAIYAVYDADGNYIGQYQVSVEDVRLSTGESVYADLYGNHIYGVVASAKLFQYEYSGDYEAKDGEKSNTFSIDKIMGTVFSYNNNL